MFGAALRTARRSGLGSSTVYSHRSSGQSNATSSGHSIASGVVGAIVGGLVGAIASRLEMEYLDNEREAAPVNVGNKGNLSRSHDPLLDDHADSFRRLHTDFQLRDPEPDCRVTGPYTQ